MKTSGPVFEVKEYSLDDTPATSTSQFRDTMALLDKYKETKDITVEETMKLCVEVRNISSQDVSLIVVRDQAHNTVNLELATNSKVAEIRMDLEDILIPDMIHFQKQTGDILFTNLLSYTLKLSKLEVTKSKIENQVRQENVENRDHQVQIKKL